MLQNYSFLLLFMDYSRLGIPFEEDTAHVLERHRMYKTTLSYTSVLRPALQFDMLDEIILFSV